MRWILRLAEFSDVPDLRSLIIESSEQLLCGLYSGDQIEKALGPVFGVDEQMIEDRTYYVVEDGNMIVGCGGWSFRWAQFGGRSPDGNASKCLNSATDAARIRAFFVHPSCVRRGIGSAIMKTCEQVVMEYGFSRGEISATLSGELLYKSFGYQTVEYYEIPLEHCLPMKVARMVKNYHESELEEANHS